MPYWIILPDPIIEEIKKKCSDKKGGEATPEKILEALKDYIVEELENFSKELFNFYTNKDGKLTDVPTADTIKRAINGRSDNGIYKKNNKVPPLLNLLSYYTFGKNWEESLDFLGLEESDIQVRVTGNNIKKGQLQTEFELPKIDKAPNPVLSTGDSNIQILDSDFWSKKVISKNAEEKIKRYFTHTDSSLALEAVANGLIIPPNDFLLVADSDNNKEFRTITEVVQMIRSESAFLLKIVTGGGEGKTSFLYWLSWKYKDSYNFILLHSFGSLDILRILLTAKSLKEKNGKQAIFLIDNVSDVAVSKELLNLIHQVKQSDELLDSAFFVADRATRYDSEFGRSGLDDLFSGNVLSILKIEIDRQTLFTKVYNLLSDNNPHINQDEIKEANKEVFLNSKLESISESIFLLIKSLKLNNAIRYKFDWEDWHTRISNNPQYQKLRYLYAIVSCFYQFGIRVSVNIKTSHLREATSLDIISAIHSFGGEKSPILLSDDNSFLYLKHEHLANWFLSFPQNLATAQGFFRDFLHEIDNLVAAKLIRKLRKMLKQDEFKNSFLAKDFTTNIYLNIVTQYLVRQNISENERVKMLTEKGIILMTLGNEQKAIEAFNDAIAMDPKSNHAKDQLARIYLQSPNTYQKALDYYFEIFENEGEYALRHIYSIIKRCNAENIDLVIPDKVILNNLHLSSTTLLEIAKYYSAARLWDEAIDVLDSITEISYRLADLYNKIGHYLPFSTTTINRKRQLFQKAISIKLQLNDFGSYKFEVDYAVFLFRIREFSECTEFLNSITRKKGNKGILIQEVFSNKVRSITKLFFAEIPNENDIAEFESYLHMQCKNAAAMINSKRTDIESIQQGILILHTVRYHAGSIRPIIFNGAALQLGYAYTYHCEKPINNLSPIENRTVAENYYDVALRTGATFALGDRLSMVKNLQDFRSVEKSRKAIFLINLFLKDPENRLCPGFYRRRGNLNSFLGNYERAMLDYEIAKRLIPKFQFRQRKDFINEKVYLLNNRALLICDMYEKKCLPKNYNLHIALSYVNTAIELNTNFKYAYETKARVVSLLGGIDQK